MFNDGAADEGMEFSFVHPSIDADIQRTIIEAASESRQLVRRRQGERRQELRLELTRFRRFAEEIA